jgi:hypothetical protein
MVAQRPPDLRHALAHKMRQAFVTADGAALARAFLAECLNPGGGGISDNPRSIG